MKILSLETTSEIASISLIVEDKIQHLTFFRSSDIASRLTSTVEDILEKNYLPLSQINYFVVSNGPGSWTGTRLSLSFVLGLAKGDKTKVYSIYSPQSIFFGIKEFKLPAICVINAYKNQMYISRFNGRFYYSKDYLPKKIPYKNIDSIFQQGEFLITGPSVSMLPEKFKKIKNIRIIKNHFSYPNAGINGLLAIEKIKRKIPSGPLTPYYGE